MQVSLIELDPSNSWRLYYEYMHRSVYSVCMMHLYMLRTWSLYWISLVPSHPALIFFNVGWLETRLVLDVHYGLVDLHSWLYAGLLILFSQYSIKVNKIDKNIILLIVIKTTWSTTHCWSMTYIYRPLWLKKKPCMHKTILTYSPIKTLVQKSIRMVNCIHHKYSHNNNNLLTNTLQKSNYRHSQIQPNNMTSIE